MPSASPRPSFFYPPPSFRRATHWLGHPTPLALAEPVPTYNGRGPVWSASSLALREALAAPLMSRPRAGYDRCFIDSYRPNETFLLPPALIEELSGLSRITDQQPAATYMRRVLEELLVDLSWSSSYLEGNAYTRMDTVQLFQRTEETHEPDAIMLLNHKRAIEFMVEAVPLCGLTPQLLRNLHGLLMADLLANPQALGSVRHQVVHINGTSYDPCQVPSVLDEMFEQIVHKASLILEPLEAAFFLWVHLAYLQCFEDGNKRLSRLAANVPLMLYNHAPLSFMDVTREDYALAMIGVYERRDLSMAIELFDWTYRRSLPKYRLLLETMSRPDPFRLHHRRALETAVVQVVRARAGIERALD
jgi:Fic/DOC family